MFGVPPDIAVFAKGMSNGYPMAAVIGKSDVMQAAQESFISSTFWTEALGPTAALATIEKMRRVDLASHVRTMGEFVQAGWRDIAARRGVPMEVSGQGALCTFSLQYNPAETAAVKTLLTQEMLDRGFLATTTFYPTLAHTSEIAAEYLAALDEVMGIIATATRDGTVSDRLRGPVASSGFSRLT